MVKIPELELVRILRRMIEALAYDYNNALDPSDSLLASYYEGVVYDNYNLFEEAVALFVTNVRHTQDASNRKISVKSYFDRNLRTTPAIHITAPTEEDFVNSIGSDYGASGTFFDDTENTALETRRRGYKSRYVIVFTSDNHIEVQLMYFTIKFLLISFFDEITLDFFQNPRMSGGELRLDDSGKAPEHFFARALTLEAFTEMEIRNTFTSEQFNNIVLPRSNDYSAGDIGDPNLNITI
jgi:hypothetical protein